MNTAQITWQQDEQGQCIPVSKLFDDVYFSKSDGLSESLYVFGIQNQLPKRFLACFDNNTPFVIGETGFGTGLNFLMACQLWLDTAKTHKNTPCLHFISTEKYPMTPADFRQALSVWHNKVPSALIEELIEAYPVPLSGCHRRHIGQSLGLNITLDLWLGDATESLCLLGEQPTNPKVDAWFLDGFAPKKNQELWSPALFDALLKLCKNDTTLATFSASGVVKAGLRQIGASFSKVKGYGKKREMLVANFCHLKPHQHKTPKNAVVIGCGVAGLMSAYALAKRGIKVSIIDKQSPLAGASGNPRALLSPKLGANTQQLSLTGFLYAQQCYQSFNDTHAVFKPTGVIDFMLPTQKSAEQLKVLVNTYPKSLAHDFNDDVLMPHTLQLGSSFDQHYKAWLPTAGLVNPQALAQKVLAHPNIAFKVCCVDAAKDCPTQKYRTDLQTLKDQADLVVICAGFESHTLHDKIFDCRKIRGQISWTDNPSLIQAYRTITPASLKYDGYACAFGDTLLFGASFVRNSTDTTPNLDEHKSNVAKLSAVVPALAQIDPNALQARVGIRGQTPDYHPMLGQIEQSVYVNSAYGSKGFGLAPLCGEVLAGLVCQEPLPITNALLDKLSPQRARLLIPLEH